MFQIESHQRLRGSLCLRASKRAVSTAPAISWGSVVKVPAVALGCYLNYLLLPFAMLLFMSVLLAVTFEPVVMHLSRLVGRKTAVGIIALFTATVFIGLGLLVSSRLIQSSKKSGLRSTLVER